MSLPVRPYTTAAIALAGTALTTVYLATSAAADPADVANQIASEGQAEITYGTGLLNQGDMVDGLAYITVGEDNVLVAAPQDALLAQIESPDQDFYYVYFGGGSEPFPSPTDLTQLTADLQAISNIGQGLLSDAANDSAQGATNLALEESFLGTNDLTVTLPETSLIGSLYISADTAQLYTTVGDYEQQYVENVFQIAANSSTPPPLPSVPSVDAELQQSLIKFGSDLVTLHHELDTTDIFPGIPITDSTALDYAGEGLAVRAIEGINLAGTVLDPSVDLADKITEVGSFFQSLF
jgi:hypothetical protein